VTVDSPGRARQLGAAFDAVQAALRSTRVVSYASTGSSLFVSADRHTTFGLIYGPQPVGFAPDSTTACSSPDTLALHDCRRALRRHWNPAPLESGGGGSGPSVLVEALLGGSEPLIVLAIVFGSFLAWCHSSWLSWPFPTTSS